MEKLKIAIQIAERNNYEIANPADVERISGARTVVVSHWGMSDRATQELMIAFYQNYVELANKAMYRIENDKQIKNERIPTQFSRCYRH